MKRIVFSAASLMGGLLVMVLVHFTGTGGDEPDLSKLPTCAVGQSAADGCVPPEYADIEKQQQATEDLANQVAGDS